MINKEREREIVNRSKKQKKISLSILLKNSTCLCSPSFGIHHKHPTTTAKHIHSFLYQQTYYTDTYPLPIMSNIPQMLTGYKRKEKVRKLLCILIISYKIIVYSYNSYKTLIVYSYNSYKKVRKLLCIVLTSGIHYKRMILWWNFVGMSLHYGCCRWGISDIKKKVSWW